MAAPDLDQRLSAIEDRAAIRDLVYRYAEMIRWGREGIEAGDLYTPDAVFEICSADPQRLGELLPRRRFAGIEAIMESLLAPKAQGTLVWPMIHNLRIELNGSQARATSVMMTAMWPHGTQMVGEYRDRFTRVEGTWRFSARTYILFGDATGAYASDAVKPISLEPGTGSSR